MKITARSLSCLIGKNAFYTWLSVEFFFCFVFCILNKQNVIAGSRQSKQRSKWWVNILQTESKLLSRNNSLSISSIAIEVSRLCVLHKCVWTLGLGVRKTLAQGFVRGSCYLCVYEGAGKLNTSCCFFVMGFRRARILSTTDYKDSFYCLKYFTCVGLV